MLVTILFPEILKLIPAFNSFMESQITFISLLKTLFLGYGGAYPPTMLSMLFGALILVFFVLAVFFWIWNFTYAFRRSVSNNVLKVAAGFSIAFALAIFIFSSVWPLLFPALENAINAQGVTSISAAVPDAGFFYQKICASVFLILITLISVAYNYKNKFNAAIKREIPALRFAILIALTMIFTSWFFFGSLQNTADGTGFSDSVFMWGLNYVMDPSWPLGMIVGAVVLFWFLIFLIAGFGTYRRVLTGALNLADTIAFTIVTFIEIAVGVFLIATLNANLNRSAVDSGAMTGFDPYVGPILPEPFWITAAAVCAFLVPLIYAIYRKSSIG
jgi:hypothetical protein